MRRKGEMTSGPSTAAGPGEFVRLMFFAIQEFNRNLSCARGHTVADPGQAERFRLRFNGKTFDPALKGRGRNWASCRGEL